MRFETWLTEHWDELRKCTKSFKSDNYKNINDNVWYINYTHEIPCDSWDRLYAMYMIDERSDDLSKNWKDVRELDWAKDFDINGYEGQLAFNNYEREWLSVNAAWDRMIRMTKLGRDVLLSSDAIF